MCRTVLNIELLFIDTIFDKEIQNMYVCQVSCAWVSSIMFHLYWNFIIYGKNFK